MRLSVMNKDGDESLRAVVRGQLLNLRMRRDTRAAPRGPEINEKHAAFEIGKRPRRAVEPFHGAYFRHHRPHGAESALASTRRGDERGILRRDGRSAKQNHDCVSHRTSAWCLVPSAE